MDATQPAFSVVIPTFNRPELVPLAINSVLAQTYPAADIIVVDDGSKQDMREVLAPFGDRIRVIRQANGGLSAARNTGIQAAKTEWISFLDDDDEYRSDRLALAVEGIRRFPSANVHLTNTAIVSETGPDLELFQVRGVQASHWMELTRPISWVLRGCFFAQSLVVRRATMIEIGLFRKMFYEDMDMYVRLTRSTPWIVDDRPALRLIRRNNSGAMSDEWRALPVKRCETLVQIHRESLQLAGLNEAERRLARTGLGTYLFDLGAALLASGDRKGARRCFAESARAYPGWRSRLKSAAAIIASGYVVGLVQDAARKRKGVVR